jgi:hypothetical protein
MSICILSLAKQKGMILCIEAFQTLSKSRRQSSTSFLLNTRVVTHGIPKSLSSLCMSTSSSTTSSSTSLSDEDRIQLELEIKIKGDEIRTLKESGADKATVAPLVEQLLSLKATLSSGSSSTSAASADNIKSKGDASKQGGGQASSSTDSSSSDDAESDFITPRVENYSKWYNDIIRVTGLAEPSPVRGCMVIKPWGMSLWDMIRNDLDHRIKERGVENAYFPLLIPKSFLSKEAEHVDGFAKECAVVTHHRLTVDTSGENRGLIADPEAELEEPLIIRPTSETIIWNMFSKWIKSYRYVYNYMRLTQTFFIYPFIKQLTIGCISIQYKGSSDENKSMGKCHAMGIKNSTLPSYI